MFALSKIVGFLVLPSTFIVGLLLVGAILLICRINRWGRSLTVAGIALILAISILPLDNWLLGPLENRFPRPAALPARVDGIIVLGGAISVPESTMHKQFVLKTGAEALIEFVALARRYPDAHLVFSGGGRDDGDGLLSEADVAHEIFTALGIKDSRVAYERRSRNTRENALFAAAMIHPRDDEVWLLVAPASDMPRDVGCFRAVGWHVVAWPSGYRTSSRFGEFDFSGLAGIGNVDIAVHEWAGLLYYHLRGWTDVLFPAPAES